MEKKVIRVDQRTVNTKHSVRNLRKQGIVPGFVRTKGWEYSISVKERITAGLGGAHLIEILLPGGCTTPLSEVSGSLSIGISSILICSSGSDTKIGLRFQLA